MYLTSSGPSIIFNNNKATTGNGGAIAVVKSTINAFDSARTWNAVFKSNEAVLGGAIAVVGGSADLIEINSATFEGNTAESGGALAISGGTVSVHKSTFTGNQATNGDGKSHVGLPWCPCVAQMVYVLSQWQMQVVCSDAPQRTYVDWLFHREP